MLSDSKITSSSFCTGTRMVIQCHVSEKYQASPKDQNTSSTDIWLFSAHRKCHHITPAHFLYTRNSFTSGLARIYWMQTMQYWAHFLETRKLHGFSIQGECSTWLVKATEISLIPEPAPHYQSNAEEVDARIWRHAKPSMANDILIYSPDTDIYNSGLGLLHTCTSKHAIHHSVKCAKISRTEVPAPQFSSPERPRPCLSSMTTWQHIAPTLQSLFICTGCDFVSYFKSIGKPTFFNNFLQHTKFICGNDMSGSLHQTSIHNQSSGFLSFLRLVGTVYFKKHLAAFNSQYGHEAPQHLINSIDSTVTNQERHQLWLQKIRETVAERITCEEERVPSFTALWRHWLRSCWISQLWQNSPQSDVYSQLPPPDESGWLLHQDGSYTINWEDPEVQQKIKGTIDFLIKGCSCRKGCKSKACGCRKKSRFCGPGCECRDCVQQSVESESEGEGSKDEGSDTHSDNNSFLSDDQLEV